MVFRSSGQVVSRMSSCGSVSGMFNWEETPGQTQQVLEGMYLLTGSVSDAIILSERSCKTRI